MERFIFLILFGCITSLIQAQRVSNVSAIQEGQKLRIKYELSTTSTTEVILYISENNGGTWMKVSQNLSGEVGPKVNGGSKEMVWDVLQARESLVGNSIVFKVKAGSEMKSVIIGNQVWMAENLNVDHYRNGDPIPTGLSSTQWESTTNGAYAIYNDDPVNEKIYGKLYNWYAVNDSRGLCPEGWHLPSEDEWKVLINILGGENEAGEKMKSLEVWAVPDWVITRAGLIKKSGFNALPGGCRIYEGDESLNTRAEFWSISEFSSYSAWHYSLVNYSEGIGKFDGYKSDGFSVRCLKD